MLRHDHKPVIFLINNGGYTIERCWLGKTSRFNDVANWAYADLPKVFRPDTTAVLMNVASGSINKVPGIPALTHQGWGAPQPDLPPQPARGGDYLA